MNIARLLNDFPMVYMNIIDLLNDCPIVYMNITELLNNSPHRVPVGKRIGA